VVGVFCVVCTQVELYLLPVRFFCCFVQYTLLEKENPTHSPALISDVSGPYDFGYILTTLYDGRVPLDVL
jgi:hypothetical protein